MTKNSLIHLFTHSLPSPPVTKVFYPAAANPVQVFLQLFGAPQLFNAWIATGQGFVIEQQVNGAVAGLAKLDGGTVTAAFLPRH